MLIGYSGLISWAAEESQYPASTFDPKKVPGSISSTKKAVVIKGA